MMPAITIVTPSYNQAAYLETTLQSVLSQGYPRLEYIVIDGGSTDGSVEILRRYGGRIAFWVSEPDGGQTEAINKGLRRASGDVLAYLNSDDLYLPGALDIVGEYFAAHLEAGLVYGDCQVIGADGQALGWLPKHDFSLERMFARGEFIPQPAAFWRRAVPEQVGGFDETLHLALDYDFFIRTARRWPVAYLPRPLAAFRLHGGSKTIAREESHWREALRVSERHGLRPWHAWYWLRRLRHYGARALPAPARRWLAGRLGRAQGAYSPPGAPP